MSRSRSAVALEVDGRAPRRRAARARRARRRARRGGAPPRRRRRGCARAGSRPRRARPARAPRSPRPRCRARSRRACRRGRRRGAAPPATRAPRSRAPSAARASPRPSRRPTGPGAGRARRRTPRRARARGGEQVACRGPARSRTRCRAGGRGTPRGGRPPAPTATSAGRSGRPSRVPGERDRRPHRPHGEADLARRAGARLQAQVEPCARFHPGSSARCGPRPVASTPSSQPRVSSSSAKRPVPADLHDVAEGVGRHARLGPAPGAGARARGSCSATLVCSFGSRREVEVELVVVGAEAADVLVALGAHAVGHEAAVADLGERRARRLAAPSARCSGRPAEIGARAARPSPRARSAPRRGPAPARATRVPAPRLPGNFTTSGTRISSSKRLRPWSQRPWSRNSSPWSARKTTSASS